MLNGKWHFFLKKSLFSAKKCRFLILTKNPKTNTTLLLPKILNLQNLKSDCQYLTRRSTKRHFSGTFWQKMAIFETRPFSKLLFLSDFWWGKTTTCLVGVLSFWLFLVIFGQKMPFCTPSGKVLTIWLQILKIQIFWQ